MLELEKSFKSLQADAIIIGFTGGLGSGCTFLSSGLAEHHLYLYISLSKYLHGELKKRGEKETAKNLQDIGNKLRAEYGNNFLALRALEEVELSQEKFPDRKNKIVIDGIRNTGEIELLRNFPYFFLISVQAEREKRQQRMIEDKKCNSADEFLAADKRDEEEDLESGQQVKKCNYLADFIVTNDTFINKLDEDAYKAHINGKIYTGFVSHIEQTRRGNRISIIATADEALMSSAFVESKRSTCLKRKVGTVISTLDGTILSSGYNDPPDQSCISHPSYRWCARDVELEKMGRAFKKCPNCGADIIFSTKCQNCKSEIKTYTRRCPNCNKDPAIEYFCPCGKEIFKEYLPGGKPETGKMLDICRALHAEENAILNLSKLGAPFSLQLRLYTTTFPCDLCATKIVKMGVIKEVVYSEPYVTREAKELFERKGVGIRRFEGIKSNAYFKLMGY